MANDLRVFFLQNDVILKREIKVDDETTLGWLDWLNTIEDERAYWYLIRNANWQKFVDGVLAVTNFRRGVGVFPDFEKLMPRFSESLKKRFEVVDHFEWDGRIFDLHAFTQGIDLPPNYEGWLQKVNKPGWQIFSYEEMQDLIKIVKAFLKEDESPFEESWQELIINHHTSNYDFALFSHTI